MAWAHPVNLQQAFSKTSQIRRTPPALAKAHPRTAPVLLLYLVKIPSWRPWKMRSLLGYEDCGRDIPSLVYGLLHCQHHLHVYLW